MLLLVPDSLPRHREENVLHVHSLFGDSYLFFFDY